MFRHILEGAIWIINAVSIMVLLWGVLLTVKNFVISEIKSKDRIQITFNERVEEEGINSSPEDQEKNNSSSFPFL